MDPGKVNGWWVVAAAATPILIDLVTGPAYRASAFVIACILLGFPAFLIWSALNDPTK